MVEVVAALIRREGKFLICRRPAHKARGLLWEFVGGKVEKGESPEQALVRECKEELDIAVSVGEMFAEVTHGYSDITVHVMLFNSAIVGGQPQLLEHSEIKWITPEEIPQFDFCPADKYFLELLMQKN